MIGAGLSLRALGPGFGLRFEITGYGGSVLWGAMVYGWLACLVPRGRPARLAVAALILTTAVELSRHVHAPGLDDVRLTAAGALLLGRVLSLVDIAAYAAGIAVAVAFDLGRSARRPV